MAKDFNCDLGEGEPASLTRSLMRRITSANVACGGHAGDTETMWRCVQLAGRHQVNLGAHPGPWNRADHGRRKVTLTPAELELLLMQQIGALAAMARKESVPLRHVKLHGALYHAVETDPVLARTYVKTVAVYWPEARVIALAGGRVVKEARRQNFPVWQEVFTDRAYQSDGQLVPRSRPGAVLHEPVAIRKRAHDLKQGFIETIDDTRLRMDFDTICVHADSPNALRTLRLLERTLTT